MNSGNNCIIDPQKECFGIHETKRLEIDLEKLKKTFYDFRDKTIGELEIIKREQAVRNEQYNQIIGRLEDLAKSISNLAAELSSLKDKPAKKWDGFVDKVFYTIIGIIIAFVLKHMGIG